ncbi:hypothetical protein ACHAPQ_010705 [Fusarium lateritium]
MTAWGMLKRSGVKLKPGNSILIGPISGGVGTAVAQLVRTFNMDLKMFGTCSPQKFEYFKSLGVIPIDRYASDVVDQIRVLTNGEGVDVAYDAVGSEESLQRSHNVTKKDIGQVISIGVMGEIPEDSDGLRHTPQELFQLLSSRMAARSSFFSVVPPNNTKSRQGIVDKVRTGRLNLEIVKLYRLDQAIEAHHAIISGKNKRGKMANLKMKTFTNFGALAVLVQQAAANLDVVTLFAKTNAYIQEASATLVLGDIPNPITGDVALWSAIMMQNQDSFLQGVT